MLTAVHISIMHRTFPLLLHRATSLSVDHYHFQQAVSRFCSSHPFSVLRHQAIHLLSTVVRRAVRRIADIHASSAVVLHAEQVDVLRCRGEQASQFSNQTTVHGQSLWGGGKVDITGGTVPRSDDGN